ncbi:MAG: FAD-dependent oxidoreductase, partial [Candidatus Eisenbacteria bacterium]|nr:FAD-dependent oxidoreductase [Candidatus Eisenbacteria bacterium]
MQGHLKRGSENRPPLNEPYDVVIVGGGVHGAGVARDAALRGHRVLLVEQGDWASGT